MIRLILFRLALMRAASTWYVCVCIGLPISNLHAAPEGSARPTAQRVPWTTSRLLGSPEAPLPYVGERVYTNLVFDNPTELDFLPDGSYGLVIERTARILAFENRPNVTQSVMAADLNLGQGGRTEAYAIVFDPGFVTNRHVFISMTLRRGGDASMKVSRFSMTDLQPPRIDVASELPIITWPSGGHNGCDLHFGLDNFLYVSAGDGDGPAPPDPRRTGQNLDDLLCTIFRIDVRQSRIEEPYRIPPNNPFVGQQAGARPEIWAYGFRNPWKTCIDPRDGALWIGDVGWENWELVFRVDHGGFNGGWSTVEGPQNIHPDWPRGPTPITPPVAVHPHTEATSITGGRVYQGRRLPELKDAFIYGDWGTGRLWALKFAEGKIIDHRELALTAQRIVGFAEDQTQELFYIDNTGGGIYRLSPNPTTAPSRPFPRLLSETGLFTDPADYQLAPGVYDYEITAPMWSDHAEVTRALALPGRSKLRQARDLFEVPTNAVFARTLSLEMERGQPTTRRRIETQILHFDGLNFNGYSYRWNEDQTDADLVDKAGLEIQLSIQDNTTPLGRRDQTWRFLSRSECVRCHISRYNSRFGNLTGLVPEQLSTRRSDNRSTELKRLEDLHLIDHASSDRSKFDLVNPYDDQASTDQRARSWLHANCAHCHRRDGGGAVVMYLQHDLSLPDMHILDEPAARGTFGLSDAKRVAPGQPYRSTLLYRILTTSSGRMPVIGSTTVDDVGATLIRDWIEGLKPGDRTALELTNSHPRILSDDTIASRLSEWLTDTAGAMSLAMVTADTNRSSQLRQLIVAESRNAQHAPTRDLFERFRPADERRQVLGVAPAVELILRRTGDPKAGRDVFFSATGPQCFTCHRLFDQGQDFGPDLTHIATKYDRSALLQQILNPSETMDPAWTPHTLTEPDGESITGFILNQPGENLRLKIAADTVIELPKESSQSTRKLQTSLMPDGLLQSTTAQEAADLLSFLESLR